MSELKKRLLLGGENSPLADGEAREDATSDDGEMGLADKPGDVVHMRAKELAEKHPHLDYGEAVGSVLNEDPALKAAYARS
jgi:hypothetical protein